MPKTSSPPINMQKRVSVEFIKNTGNFAVKAPRGEKNPGKEWDPKNNNKTKSEQVLHDAELNDENLGVHFFGDLVDVDVDTDVPFLREALDKFLPPCAHVWGRPSKTRSHRAYMLKQDEPYDPTDHHILRRLEKIDEAKVEVRGGAQSRGEYSLLPGSIHTSGEPYEWADLNRARNSPSVATIDQIVRGVRLAGAIAVIAPHMIEGTRNDLTMALSGFLYKAWSISQTLGGDAFAMSKEEAERFIEVLLELSGDDPADRVARIKTFHATWKKAESGEATTGATTIGDITGNREVVQKLYILLTDSPDIAAIEEFTNRFCIWQGPGLVIDMDQMKRGDTKAWMARQNFQNSYGHKFILVEGKRKQLTDLLFYLESTTRVAGITFEPGENFLVETRTGKKVNQWSGFAMKPHPEPVADDEIRWFLDYVMDILASGDERTFQWIMGWIAHILQEPANKSQTSLVLVGIPGAGKSFLGAEILAPMIGEAHAATTKSVDSITRGFNVLFDNKVFVQCDEAMNNRQKATAAKLKSIITDPWIEVEPKGIDPFHKPNHMRLMFTSNEVEDAINLEDGNNDRRYTIIEVSSKMVGHLEDYWLPFLEWLKDARPKIMRWLMDYKYERAFICKPLQTEAKTRMQQHSWSTFDAWLAAWVSRNHPLSDETHEHWFDAPVYEKKGVYDKSIVRTEWPTHISNAALARDYARFARNYGRSDRPLNEVQIADNLIRRGLRTLGDARIRLPVKYFDEKKRSNQTIMVGIYPVAPRERVLEYLLQRYGFVPDSLGEIMKLDTVEETEF